MYLYSDPHYVDSLQDGVAFDLQAWSMTLRRRAIPNSSLSDLAGAYPMIRLPGTALADGFEEMRSAGAISVVAVLDPFGPLPDSPKHFFDVYRPFKSHHVVRPGRGLSLSKHHRYMARRAARDCEVMQIRLADHIEDWIALYAELIEKRELTGAHAFSHAHFRVLADSPSIECFAAFRDGAMISAGLWFTHEGVAYYHLGASNDVGYRVSASYALVEAAIGHYRAYDAIDLGGVPGALDDASHPLSKFKAGFANDTVTTILCGAALDPERYAALSSGTKSDYFPAYRDPGKAVATRA